MHDNLTPTPKSAYDYSKLIAAAKEESQYECFSAFISERIDAYRKAYYDGEAHRFTRNDLAEIIGIETSTLTKIINGSQMTRKRDIIIAICFALKMSLEETNLALNLYPMMALNRHNIRDLVISQARNDDLSVSELNSVLAKHKLPQLNLLRDKRNKEVVPFYYSVKSLAYDELSVEVQPYCIAGDDLERSLHQRYRPDQFDYHSEMMIRSQDGLGIEYRITLEDTIYEISKRHDDEWNLLHCNEPFADKYFNVLPCNDADLLREIARLQDYTDQKARYIHAICADTRNYGSRFDAINDNGQLVIYGEMFGADAPELCEYYQIVLFATECVFTVSDNSRFMERYLGNSEWMRLYGSPLSPVKHTFSKPEDIPNQRWLSHFLSLIKGAKELLVQIQNHQLFLFNARAWIEIDDLMHIYKVEDAFDCVQPDDLPYEIIPQKDFIMGSDGKPITIDDLYRAAELDIHSVEELCAVRERYGSLEGFLTIEMLTEQKGKKNE